MIFFETEELDDVGVVILEGDLEEEFVVVAEVGVVEFVLEVAEVVDEEVVVFVHGFDDEVAKECGVGDGFFVILLEFDGEEAVEITIVHILLFIVVNFCEYLFF